MASTDAHASARRSSQARAGAAVRAAKRVTATATSAAASATSAAAQAVSSATTAGGRAVASRAAHIAVSVPVRDLETLRDQYGGIDGEELADALVEAAARSSVVVGAAGGAATVRMAMRRNPIMLPLQLVAEPLVVAAVEIKLLAELHEVYDVPVVGTGSERARRFASMWASMRGLNPLEPGTATTPLGGGMKGQLSRRIAGRIGARMTRTGPFVAGAAAGAFVNGRGTRDFGEAVRANLRRLRADDSTG